MSNLKSRDLLHELNLEYPASRTCLERIPESLFDYKPHPKSMNMGYLALLVAEIPLWIEYMVTVGEIDFDTFKHAPLTTNEALLNHFEENMAAARKALESTNDEMLEENFNLKSHGQVFYTSKKAIDIGVTLNHWVHHRGQLTVYMRLNEIPVPSIYGPSADDNSFVAPK